MLLAALVFLILFQASPLATTATATYYSMGLAYEWLHYVVHTKWVPGPGNTFLRAIRRHHMLHHCRNEEYWLSFILPAVDGLFGTLPQRGAAVPLTPMARKAQILGRGSDE
jgi:sterol desaturase/sphingolipid hydroxylase (fatty acid hydroxylase superfamily)